MYTVVSKRLVHVDLYGLEQEVLHFLGGLLVLELEEFVECDILGGNQRESQRNASTTKIK
ncbi:hypothetical protein ACLOJK_022840 [Asimina triloba]